MVSVLERDFLSLNLKQPPPAAFRSIDFHGNSPTLCRAHCPPRRPAFARRSWHLVPLAQAALLVGHLEGSGSLRSTGKVPQQPAAGSGSGVGLHLFAHPLSRHLRHIYLAARKIEYCVLSLGRELDVPRAALHRPDRLRLYPAARDSPAVHGHQPA